MEELNTYCIYCHTNKINGKKYIGQTIHGDNPELRWGTGGCFYKRKQSHFWSAIQKYGWDNFYHEVIEDNLTLEESNEKEEYYIMLYETLDPSKGYNKRHGGSHGSLSEETKEKLRLANTGKKNPHSKESIHKLSESMMGHSVSQETKDKISATLKGHTPWNKGLTKDDLRVKKYADTQSVSRVGMKMPNNHTNQGKRWFTNGVLNIMTEVCPDGFYSGLTRKQNKEVANEQTI